MDKERTAILLNAITISIGLTAVFMLVFTFINPAPKSEERFKVVDTYKNCNVIRYTDPSNNWHYFLRCST
jgi:hypothetical protein